MKKFFFMAALLAATCFTALKAQTSVAAQQSHTAAGSRATEGEKVWVIVNHVKADKKDQFEKFVHEIFWPMATKLSAEDQRLFQQTRVLHPTKAEADGTYSYLFIMDPLIEGGDYDIASLLKKIYGEQKGAEYNRMFEETAAREQTGYELVQSHH